MEQRVVDVLRDYERRAAEENRRVEEIGWDAFIHHRDEFLLAVGPTTGQLIHLLATGLKAKTLLEVGSSYGYSTIWMADAARANGGRVISLDLVAEKQEYAKAQLQRAELADYVEFRVGDALETIPQVSGPLDFVLLDLWKDLYIPCFFVSWRCSPSFHRLPPRQRRSPPGIPLSLKSIRGRLRRRSNTCPAAMALAFT